MGLMSEGSANPPFAIQLEPIRFLKINYNTRAIPLGLGPPVSFSEV